MALDANIVVTFDQAVDLTGEWYSLACSDSIDRSIGTGGTVLSGGPITWGLNPAANFELGTTCMFDVLASQVAAQGNPALPMENDASVYFEVTGVDVCSEAFTPIFQIQGSGASAAITGTITSKGIVSASYEGAQPALRGYYMQDPVGDGNPETSDGLFVFTNGSTTVNQGDLVVVTGTAGENQGQTQLSSVTGTTICSSSNTVESTSVNLPVPAAVGGVDYLERFEGMLVDLPQTLFVTEMFQLGRFGQVVVSVNERQWQPTHRYLPGSPDAVNLAASNLLGRIILDDATNEQNRDPLLFGRGGSPLSASNTLRGGDTVTGYEGIMTYTWAGHSASGNAWRVRPIGAAYPNFQATNPRPAPIARTTDLRVTALNLLNFFNTFSGCTAGAGGDSIGCRGASNNDEFVRQIYKTVPALYGADADVIAIAEIENDGYGGGSAIDRLVLEMNIMAGGPGIWAYINPDTLNGVNSLGTDAIKVGILYKPSKVTPVGDTAVLNTPEFVTGGDVVPNEGTTNSNRTRPALAQTFVENATGAHFTVVANHFKSKGSACDVPDQGDGQGNCNIVRTNAANELIEWLATYPTGIEDDDVLIMGDLNSYAMEDPIMAIKNAGYTDLAYEEAGYNAYSYVFDGAWGYLDYSMASNSLAAQVENATTWHINSDEPAILDYTFDFKSAAQQALFFAPDEFRTSDHDPVLVDLSLRPEHTLTVGKDGTGTGSVSSNPAGISCGVDCGQSVLEGDVITLTATADVSSNFTGWSGDCTGTDACAVTMDAAKAVTATFAIVTHTLTVDIPTGHGAVTLNPPGGVYTRGTVVTVTFVPDTGYRWSGYSQTGPPYCTYYSETQCQMTMTGDGNLTVNFELLTFQLLISKTGNGIGTTSYPSAFPFAIFDYGTVVTPTATADVSSHFTGWSGNCTGLGPCVLTMTSLKSIVANFTLNQYALTTATDGTGGGSVSTNPATGAFNHGTEVTVTPTANADSDFVGWAGACSGSGACVVTMDAAKTVTATFDLKSYALTTATAGSGSISTEPAGPNFTHGTVVTVTATPATGHHLAGWSGDCTGDGSCVLTMDAAKSVTATFEINSYALTTATVGSGSISTEPAGSTFNHGTVVTVTATPDIGRHFAGWSGDCTDTGDCVVTMDAAKSVTATFGLNLYNILTSTIGTGGGHFLIDPAVGPYTHGMTVTITAIANANSLFAGWSGDCLGTGACTFQITGNKSIAANFLLQEYALTTATDGTGSGTVTIEPNGETFAHGTVVTVTATADSGSTFAGWAGACTGTGACAVTMDAAKSVTATFDLDEPLPPITHTVSVTLAGNGSGLVTSDPAGIDCGEECSVSVESGSVITLAVTISSGTLFSGWEGATCGDAPICAITVTANTLITATFDLEMYEVTIPDVEGGTIDVQVIDGGEAQSAAFTASYPYGTVLELTAVPDEGYLFSGWTGDLSGMTNPIQMTVTGAVNVGATFGLMGEPDYSIYLPTISLQEQVE